MKFIAKAFIYFYKYLISPLLPNCCRYTPSCSTYAIEAYNKHSFVNATILTIKRVLSCNPFSKKDIFDEVPEEFSVYKSIKKFLCK